MHPHPVVRPKDGRLEGRERLSPDVPHNCRRNTAVTPAAHDGQKSMQANVAVSLTPRQHSPAVNNIRGQRTPTACHKDGQQGEGERLTADVPHDGARNPPRGCPPSFSTARNAGLQERTLWGRCWVPTPAPPAPGKHGQPDPANRPSDRQPGEGERLTPEAPHNGATYPPPGNNLQSPPRHSTPRMACTPRGQCRFPTSAHFSPQRMGNGPRLPAPRTVSRGRMSAQSQTPLATAQGNPPGIPAPAPTAPEKTRELKPKGPGPTPQHLHQQYMGNRCRLPGPRTGS